MKNKYLLTLGIPAILTMSIAAQEYRSVDGSGNNQTVSQLGSAGDFLRRLTPPSYIDGMGAVDPTLPNARTVSNVVGTQTSSIPDSRNLSEWAWVWGQFLDHDMDHTPNASAAVNGTLPIPIPADDPVFGSMPAGSQINMTRNNYVYGTGTNFTPRVHANMISSFLDGGMIYGGRAGEGASRSQWLRDTAAPGKLKVSDGGIYGDLLPKYEAGAPAMANVMTPGMGANAYVAGDIRANENNSLLALHTVFVREHNRIVDAISAANPLMSSDELYQAAKKVVSAEIQAITANEYLPAMGVNLSTYDGYKADVDPGIFTEFSNAAFRVHTQINDVQLRLDAAGNVIAQGNSPLANAFFNPSKILEGGLDPIVRGLTTQTQEANDIFMVESLRSQLFQIFVGGTGLVDNAADLFAIDLQRGRDVGLGSFNDVRAALGLDPALTFSDVTANAELAAALESVYGDIGSLELFVGLFAEDLAPGSSMGETLVELWALQFENVRDGDRFWYENDLDGINSDLLMLAKWDGENEESAYDWLSNLTLSELLENNTGVEGMPENAFFAAAVPEPSQNMLVALTGLLLCLRRRR